jgi:hypothetical protein
MAIYPIVTTDWDAMGLMPLRNIEFWNQFGFNESGHSVIYDYSGNNRHIACDPSGNPPVLTENVLAGQTGWVFDGSNDPLIDAFGTAPFTLRHFFILLKVTETTFAANTAIISDQSSNDILLADDGTTKFQDAFTGTYHKNDTVFVGGDRQAPMNAFALIEMVIPDGETVDLLTLNRTGNFNGIFLEMAGWSEELTVYERRRAHLHFNLRFRTNLLGIPLFAPTRELVPALEDQARVNNRFNDIAIDWSTVTEEFEYEDRGKDFNEVSDTLPRRWEYAYQNVPKAQKPIFDAFNDLARRSTPFYFKDNENVIWSDVRIERYDRNHDEHKRWRNDVTFGLVGYDSTITYEAAEVPISDGGSETPTLPEGLLTFLGEPVTFLGDYLVFNP